jgi:hypothetical protein
MLSWLSIFFLSSLRLKQKKERKKELHKVQLRVQLRKLSVCAGTDLHASTPDELPCKTPNPTISGAHIQNIKG